jgi:hypothetical protein
MSEHGGQTVQTGRPVASALWRQRALLEFALASLLRHPGKAAALGAVLTLIVFLLTSLAFLRSSVRLEAAAVLREAPDAVIQRLVAGRPELVSEDTVAAVRTLPGVVHAQGRLWGYYYDPAAGANYTMVVPLTNPPAEGEAAIGGGISRSRQSYSRDVFALRSYRGEAVLFHIKTVLPDRADLIAADVMFVSESDFRQLFDLPAGMANDIVVRLAPEVDLRALRREAARAIPGARVVTRHEMLATAASFLDERQGLPAIVLLALALAIGIVAADKPAALGAEERREIGILRALGWGKTEVLVAKLWESLSVSVTALLVGTLLAYVHIYLFGAALFAPVLRGWAVLFPALNLVPTLNLGEGTLIAVAAVLPPAAGTLCACYRPASGDPDAIIRE